MALLQVKYLTRLSTKSKFLSNWKQHEIIILLNLVSHLANFYKHSSPATLSPLHWQELGNCMPGRTPADCKHKVFSFNKTQLKNNKWTQIQNQLLMKITSSSKELNWMQISIELYQKNPSPDKIYRSSRQCKENYYNTINIELKLGDWNKYEDNLIMECYKQHKKITIQLCRALPGRKKSQLRFRLQSLLKSSISVQAQSCETEESIEHQGREENPFSILSQIDWQLVRLPASLLQFNLY